jgi:hypothetical protein
MALSNYATLCTAIADWLNRTDLTSQIPDFIVLAESEMKRRIRHANTSTTIYVSTGAMDPPGDFVEPIAIRLSTGNGYADTPLLLCTPEMLWEVKARSGGTAGRPTHFAHFDEQLQFAPEPDQSYDAILNYYQTVATLADVPPSNHIFYESPDVYLYGALLQATPYLEHDERIPVWQMKFDNAIEQLNEMRARQQYGAGLKEMRLPMVF